MNYYMQIVLSKQGLKLALFTSDEQLVAGPCKHVKLELRVPFKKKMAILDKVRNY